MKASPAAIGGLVAGPGLFALWFPLTYVDRQALPLSDDMVMWTAIVGIVAVIAMTWRFSSTPLALLASLAFILATVWHVATWRPGLGMPEASFVDAALDLTGSLWFNPDDGILGWVLDVMLFSVLPVFILGSMLVSRTCLGSAPEPRKVGGFSAGNLVAALHAVSRRLVPTLAIGSLFMMARPGVEPVTIALAWLLPISACLVWFWIKPVVERAITEPAAAGGRDVLLIGATLAALVFALLGGLSLQLSALNALGVVIALSFIDADIRRRPSVIPLALARGGIAFGKLLFAAAAVGLILAILDRTGLPIDVARLLAGATGESKILLVILSAVAAIATSLVMPGFAAYLIVIALTGPALRTVGIADPAAHLLVLGVSAVTVAIGRGARSTTA